MVMKRLIVDATHQAQWLPLVHEARASCRRRLDETLECWLVLLLLRFTRKTHCLFPGGRTESPLSGSPNGGIG
jgi:hypothetical protein